MIQGPVPVRLGCKLDEALPWLIAARNSGHLVPFVGAGMSMPYCAGWVEFVGTLQSAMPADTEGLAPTNGTNGVEKPDSERLYRIADRVSSWLRLLPPEERHDYLVRALRKGTKRTHHDLPPQLLALTAVSWPLMVTTNYDNLIQVGVAAENSRRQKRLALPLVIGRSVRDCSEVVRSLDNLGEPLIWHLQGHFPIADSLSTTNEAIALLDQLVLGHHQYQQAIHEAPIFRRTFAELFRRRSLLFMGSGLAESYMVNLISEALFGFGPSPRSHYALFSNAELKHVDTDFLAMRLGITPIEYGTSHKDLPAAISKITRPTRQSETSLASVVFNVTPSRRAGLVAVCLTKSKLPVLLTTVAAKPHLTRQQCVIASIGISSYGADKSRPYLGGPQATSFLRDYKVTASPDDCRPVNDAKPARVFRLVQNDYEHPVFFAASSVADSGQFDTRDLQTISDVTAGALKAASEAGFTNISMGLIGAGRRQPYSPAYCLLAQLVGIREFLESDLSQSRVCQIEVHVQNDLAWLSFAQGKLPASELLSAGLARVLVRIFDGRNRSEEFALSVPHHTKVGSVLAGYVPGKPEGKRVTVYPLTKIPFGKTKAANDPETTRDAEALRYALELRVFPGMTVEVHPN